VAPHVDCRLASIIRQFQLRFLPARHGGLYQKLVAYDHVGRLGIGLPWDVTDKAALLQEDKQESRLVSQVNAMACRWYRE
jgi:S-adenosylmethionine synthetase